MLCTTFVSKTRAPRRTLCVSLQYTRTDATYYFNCTPSQIAAHANVAALVADVASRADVQEALSQVGGVGAVRHTFAADSEAVRAAQPKLPIKGQRNVLITR